MLLRGRTKCLPQGTETSVGKFGSQVIGKRRTSLSLVMNAMKKIRSSASDKGRGRLRPSAASATPEGDTRAAEGGRRAAGKGKSHTPRCQERRR